MKKILLGLLTSGMILGSVSAFAQQDNRKIEFSDKQPFAISYQSSLDKWLYISRDHLNWFIPGLVSWSHDGGSEEFPHLIDPFLTQIIGISSGGLLTLGVDTYYPTRQISLTFAGYISHKELCVIQFQDDISSHIVTAERVDHNSTNCSLINRSGDIPEISFNN